MNGLYVLLLLVPAVSGALRCAQCNGWQGSYPLAATTANTCDNRNNQCQADNYCVKIVDPMAPHVSYTTYKSDCWYQTTIQVTPAILTQVVANTCYDYQDASVPSKRWTYCFCNDRDYCNSSGLLSLSFALSLLLFL